MKKIGLLCLVLIFALGSLGIGYAAWTDTLYIEGTVNTGDVDLEIVALSSTYVYKDLDTHECWVLGELKALDGTVLRQYVSDCDYTSTTWYWHPNTWAPPTGSFVVASSVATIDATDDDKVIVTATNLFPCICWAVDILIHYDGSIPVRINYVELTTTDPWLLDLIALGKVGVGAWESNAVGNLIAEIECDDVLGYQLHNCDYIMVIMGLHIPQDDAYMNCSGSFAGKLEVVQWNKY